jgi:AraC-like DNA-binding protein
MKKTPRSSRRPRGRPHPAAPGGEVLFERSAYRLETEGRFVPMVRPVFTGFLLNRLARPFVFVPHQHVDFEIILIVRGLYRCRLNGRELCLRADSVLVVQPGDWHEDECRPPLRYAGLNFSLGGPGGEEGGLRFFRPEVPSEDRHASLPSAAYLPLLEKIAAEAERHDAVSVRIQDAVMEELFWRLARAFPAAVLEPWLLPGTQEKDFLLMLRRCFTRNLHHSPTMAALAAELGISERTLGSRCAALLRTSPARAFLRFKIENARRLLRQTAMPVKAVGYQLGFSTPYHFSRVYKQILGHSPSHDRE